MIIHLKGNGRQSTEKDHSFFVIEVWNKYLISHRAKQKSSGQGERTGNVTGSLADTQT